MKQKRYCLFQFNELGGGYLRYDSCEECICVTFCEREWYCCAKNERKKITNIDIVQPWCPYVKIKDKE